jgi:hypothetical protein
MKNFFHTTKAVLLFSFLLFGSSCKKDRVAPSFDINNPKGYAIVYSHRNDYPAPIIAVFSEGNKVTYGSINTYGNASFRVNNDELILDDDGIDLVFKIQSEKIVSYSDNIKTAELIKIPEENQLSGKTFTGVYHNTNGAVLHPKFFYNFQSFGNNVDVGYEVGTTIRTESYTPMGNIAAFIQRNGVEFIIKMPDGRIISNYRDQNGTAYGVLK